VGAFAAEIALDLIERRFDAVEQLLHKMIVEVRHRFEQLAVRALHLLLQIRGNFSVLLDGLPGTGRRVESPRFHVDEVDVTVKLLGASKWPLLGDDVTAVSALQSRQGPREIGAGPVHLVDDEKVRHS
jgi:hypothetical protein